MNENKCSCNDSGTCSVCREARKKEQEKNKPPKIIKSPKRTPIKKKPVEKKPIDLEALKGKNVQLKNSKRVKTQEELDEINKKKIAEKQRKVKEKAKLRKEEKKYSLPNLFTLYQKFIRLVTPDTCASCNCIVGENGRQKQGGHLFIKSKYKSTSLLMPGIYSQCSYCNAPHGLQGNPIGLYKYGEKFWGTETMELIIKISKISYTFNKLEREGFYAYIVSKINEAEKLTQLKHKEKLLREVWEYQQQQQWFKNIINQIKE